MENLIYMLGLSFFFGIQVLIYPRIASSALKKLRIHPLFLILIFIVFDFLIGSLILNIKNAQIAWELREYFHIENLSILHFVISALILIIIFFLLALKINSTKSLKFLGHSAAILIILFMTLGVGTLNLFDYSEYSGPINDFILGKPLLTFRTSYGFMPMLFLGLIFKIIPLKSEYLTFVIAIFNALGFILFYFLNLKIFKSSRWAFTTTLFAIFLQHLVSWIAPYWIPQRTFIRIGIWVLLALIIANEEFLTKKFHQSAAFIPPLVAGFCFFWCADYGLFTILAYCLYLLILNLQTSILMFVKKYLTELFILLLAICTVFSFINIIYFLFYKSFPQWLLYYFSVYTYPKSGNLFSFPNLFAACIYLIILILTVSYLIFLKKQKGFLSESEKTIVFIVCIGLTTFNYFLGRPFINSINILSLPLVTSVFFMLKSLFDRMMKTTKPKLFASVFLAALVLLIPSTLSFFQGINQLKKANPYTTLQILQHRLQGIKNENDWIGKTAKVIKLKYEDEIQPGKFIIISTWGTWFAVLYHTTNAAGINCLTCYYFPNDNLDFIAENIRKSSARYLFVDAKSSFKDGRDIYIFTQLKDQYTFVETIDFLNVYRRNSS